jgi:hypothetical protein
MGEIDKQKIKYSHHDDFRFPISLMYQGLEILEKHGQEAFDKYALKTRMPQQDVERIWNKYLYNTDPAFKAKIDLKRKAIKDKAGVQLKI